MTLQILCESKGDLQIWRQEAQNGQGQNDTYLSTAKRGR